MPSIMPPPTPAGIRGAGVESGSSRFPRAVCGAFSIQNYGKSGDENQDAYITSSNASGSKNFVGVFDGHGERGKVMSNFVRNTLAKSLFQHKDLHTNPVFALESAYKSTQNEIESRYSRDAVQSGSTAVAAYQHRDQLFVANVGDSRAVLGRCDTARRNFSAVELSSDHKPSRPDERQRVLAAGGTVDQMAIPIMHGGSLRWIRGGPERVMDKNGMGGLAMSRSMGDLSLRPYVSAIPEVTSRRLDNKDKFVVIGSDGVWDHVSSQEAVAIAAQHTDPNVAAREIANVARQRWYEETGGMMSDDITAVVMKLNSPPPSSAGSGGGRQGSRGPVSTMPALGRAGQGHGSGARLGAGLGASDQGRYTGGNFGGRGRPGSRGGSLPNATLRQFSDPGGRMLGPGIPGSPAASPARRVPPVGGRRGF